VSLSLIEARIAKLDAEKKSLRPKSVQSDPAQAWLERGLSLAANAMPVSVAVVASITAVIGDEDAAGQDQRGCE
jgi:hypothetical protein